MVIEDRNLRNVDVAVGKSTQMFDIRERVGNANYENDIEETFRYTKWLLLCLGVWPLMHRQGSTYLSKLTILGCLTMIAFMFVPAALHAMFREKNPLVRIILVGPISAALASIVKYGIIVSRANALKFCVNRMESDWMCIVSEDELAIMRRNARIGRKITIVCSLFLYTGGMSHHLIVPILKGPKINEYNATIRPLVYPGYDIFVNPQTSPNYEIIFSLICVSAFVRYTVAIAICSLAAIFVSHVCGQIEIMILRLGMIFDGIVDEKKQPTIIRDRISFAVHCHARALRLCMEIDETLREIFLIEVVAATAIICLLEYYCMTEWNNSDTMAIITYVLLLTSYVFNIFILCFIGELLKEQFQQVGKAAYMIEWHRLPEKNGLAILLIILMSAHSRQMNAGRMMEFSIRNFGLIMKTSVMYLNMLRTTAL